VEVEQPTTFALRREVAETCAAAFEISLPILVDDMQDSVANAYNALPDRIFILGGDGKVAFRGARGPRGFAVDEMERALAAMVE